MSKVVKTKKVEASATTTTKTRKQKSKSKTNKNTEANAEQEPIVKAEEEVEKAPEEKAQEEHILSLDYKNPKTHQVEVLIEDDDFLYPTLNDPYFGEKIANRKEFASFKYDGKIDSVEKMSNMICANPEFSLMPHQLFVKNFLSKNTPYNSILLYHGLGSGKTCSAIGIAEEMRATMKQTGSSQRIMMIASTNVQDNFRLQLFDERKLKRTMSNGAWTIESCIGNSLIKEINPTNDTTIKADKIAAQATTIINNSYSFMGYMQLANYIQNKILVTDSKNGVYTDAQRREIEIANIRKHFNNRLLIIDEVHNIPGKTVAPMLLMIAKYAEGLRMVLMSATPMYNSVDEIIYLTNLMNINDGKEPITVGQVFDPRTHEMTASGKELLKSRLNGYISYVRGENPYTFPFRLYPDVFEPESTFALQPYPTQTITGRANVPSMQGMRNRIYVTRIGDGQKRVYDFIANHIFQRAGDGAGNIFRSTVGEAEDDDVNLYENMESFGYTKLQMPIQALIMTFPSAAMDKAARNPDLDAEEIQAIIKTTIGKDGLSSAMKFKEERKKIDEETTIYMKHQFEYKKGFEGLFSLNGGSPQSGFLRSHSAKIAAICDKILVSTGIVMVYTQYIDGGVVPMALALEELGFARYGSMQQFVKPLFKKGAALNQEPRDAITMELRPDYVKSRNVADFKQAKYMILSGDKFFSQNNAEDIKYATSAANKNGENVRVILISRAASEGLDFKFVRQVHVLDPWYNLNRIEQIVGRGVRNMSHCGLPFEERNVEVYLHATIGSADSREYADHYVYRYAEQKAIGIGKVTRLMKQMSVDCVLNIGQTQFTDVQLATIAENQNIEVHPSSKPVGTTIVIKVGDKKGTEACDYADTCDYTCSTSATPSEKPKQPIAETYSKEFIEANSGRLLEKVKNLYRGQKTIYHKNEIRDLLTSKGPEQTNSITITDEQISYVLTQLVTNPLETVEDMLGREGRILNRGDFYLFQPIEITDKRSNAIENQYPADYKPKTLNYKISEAIKDIENDGIASIQSSIGSQSPLSPTDAALVNKDAEIILSEIEEQYDIVTNPTAEITEAGETSWTKVLNSTRGNKDLIQYYLVGIQGLTKEEIYKYAFEHIIDVLHYREKRILIEYLYESSMVSLNPSKTMTQNKFNSIIEKMAYAYFEARKFEKMGLTGFLLARANKGVIKNVFLLYENGEWKEEEPGDMIDFKQEFQQRMRKDVSRFNEAIGFMGYFKGRSTTLTMVFKTKLLNMGKNNKGAYLQNEGKAEILKKYNALMTSTGKQYSAADLNELSKVALAVLLEIVMRHYNYTNESGKIWTLSPEEAIYNGIEAI